MREYKIKLSKYNISPGRRKELEGFCQQYYEKKAELKEIYALSSVSPDSSVKSGVPGKPTENKAMRANQLPLKKLKKQKKKMYILIADGGQKRFFPKMEK